MKINRKNIKHNNFKNQKEIYDFWENEKLFRANPSSNKKPYSLLIPPPNLTGELHLDHASIQFEATLDRKLKKKNISKEKLGREKWLEEAWKFKSEVYKSVSKTWRFLGLSADWSHEVFTLDEGPRRAVFEEFKTYFEKGLIYKGPYIVQWCPKCNTAIEDVELEYEERDEKLYYVKYFLDQHPASGKSHTEHIVVATARPETIFADVAIAVHPDSPFKKYVGMTAYIPAPLNPRGRQDHLGVIADERIDKNFGTGALKITPGHDALDYKIGLDNKLPIYHAVDKS